MDIDGLSYFVPIQQQQQQQQQQTFSPKEVVVG
jgi:hypothetical protein